MGVGSSDASSAIVPVAVGSSDASSAIVPVAVGSSDASSAIVPVAVGSSDDFLMGDETAHLKRTQEQSQETDSAGPFRAIENSPASGIFAAEGFSPAVPTVASGVYKAQLQARVQERRTQRQEEAARRMEQQQQQREAQRIRQQQEEETARHMQEQQEARMEDHQQIGQHGSPTSQTIENVVNDMTQVIAEGNTLFAELSVGDSVMGDETAHLKRTQEESQETDSNIRAFRKRSGRKKK